jgi:hypothetical protein
MITIRKIIMLSRQRTGGSMIGLFCLFFGLGCGDLSVRGATYYVNSIAGLTSRINAALLGDEIVVSNGVYTTIAPVGIDRAGAEAKRLIIRAETIGGVEITGTHGFSLNRGAAYVTVQGFKFTHAASINLNRGAHHCRLTRNIIELNIPAGADVSYVNILGDDMEIDRNELRNKSTLGNMLDVTGTDGQVARRLWVHHNYFHDFTSAGGNGAETIRWGLSGLSLSTGSGLCEYNLFVRCNGENEMISNKSSGNTYRYNTVIDSREISQRHGNDCRYYGNYLKKSGGLRVYGDRHKIFNNYLEGNSIGFNMGNGGGDVYNGAKLTAHDRPDDNLVAFNTFINNATHYQMGGRAGGLGSSNTVVANNIFCGGGSAANINGSSPHTSIWTNNICWNAGSSGNMPANGYSTLNPLLLPDASGVYRLQSGSPAINTAGGASDVSGANVILNFVSADMDGQPRDAKRDIGADEFSTAPVLARILSTNEVGPFSGYAGSAAAGETDFTTIDVAAIDRARILKSAATALIEEPITITKFRALLSEGGLHDFYSNGDYWWPNPNTTNGLPYVQRDGQSNPENFIEHRRCVMGLRDAVATLGAAYKITGEDRYAAKAAMLLRVFFVDTATRMNPSLKYAQAIPGVTPGRGIGIIDTLHLVEVPLAIRAMEKSKSFPPEVRDGVKQWFREYVEWMTTSKNGIEEANAGNNHAVAFWLQVAAFSQLTEDEAKLAECRKRFKEVFIAKQMTNDGSFPQELRRTKPYAYSIFQLDNMAALAQLLTRPEENLWLYTLPDGRGMRQAMEFLYPYLADKPKWPRKPDVQAWDGWPARQPSLLFGGLAFGEQRYLDLWKKLPPNPIDPEVKRNIAITQPLLWLP